MTRAPAIANAAFFLDEGVEALTFERFDWALEDAWRGVAWLLAWRGDFGAPPALPPRGQLPEARTLGDLVAPDTPDGLALLVARLESLRLLLDADLDLEAACAAHDETIAALVFESAAALDALAEQAGMAPAVVGVGGSVPPPGSVPGDTRARPSGILRRDALKFLAASSALTLAGCARSRGNAASASEPAAATSPSGASDTPTTPATASAPAATVRTTTRLDGLHWPVSDPFLFCAHHHDAYPQGNEEMGPAASLAGRNLGRDFDDAHAWRMYHGQRVPGFPRHPHRGFETVTVVRTGRLDHADSMGATARYGGGDVQWLTAGGGIQHAEMFPLLKRDEDNPLELFQIWLNLPARDKMVPAHFTMLWAESIPRLTVRDAEGRATHATIVAGRYGDAAPPAPPPNSWASRPESDLALWTLRMEAGARFELPAVRPGTERSLYFHVGDGGRVGDSAVPNMTRVELGGPGPIALEAGASETEILLLQGRPIAEPVARRGPFVMNSQAEIQQAYADYRSTGFGGWPWPQDGPVHARDRDRFALRPDGTLETPG